MSGACNLFTRLSQLSDIWFVSIADSHSCSISREEVVQASSQIKLQKVLYVPDFSFYLLPFYLLVLLPSNCFVMLCDISLSLHISRFVDWEDDWFGP